MTRRDLLKLGSLAFVSRFEIPLSLDPKFRKPLKFAVISDLHHGFAPDAMARASAFIQAVKARKDLDCVLQLGDFCYSDAGSQELLDKFKEVKLPIIHVLGNHDMDRCTKERAMATIGMRSRFDKFEFGDFTFVVLDLNNIKRNGEVIPYANGNYFTDNAILNSIDPEQKEWLRSKLATSKKPVILLSHQPLGFAEQGKPLPPEQQEVIDLIKEVKALKGKSPVALSMFGHLHVDRLEYVDEIPFYCVNSASYFWSEGMCPYTKPLFSLMELTTDGRLIVEGVHGEFVNAPPKASDKVIGRSASISNRKIRV